MKKKTEKNKSVCTYSRDLKYKKQNLTETKRMEEVQSSDNYSWLLLSSSSN